MYVVMVGPERLAQTTLTHYTLRNAARLLYLSYLTDTGVAGTVSVISRCLYCDAGSPSLVPLHTWTLPHLHTQLPHNLFPDETGNLRGLLLKVVTMEWFPFIKFTRSSEEGGVLVYPLDSLDFRMLQTVSSRLNFTYEMRVPWDNQWGTSAESGNWTGIVGTLQHHKADFSMMLSWLYNRLPVVDYSRIYTSEPLVMVTSKPLPLTKALALVRPFSGVVWVMTLASTVFAGVCLWGLQRGWAWVSGGRGLGVDKAIMLTLGIMLEDPPPRLPKNITAQMVLGWWWVYCMLLTIVYRSSLIAHLTVPGKSVSLESLEDLLEANKRESWTWGYEPLYGSGWEWLKINQSPTVKEIFDSILILDFEEQMSRVLAGHHAFITWKYYIRAIIGSRYTDSSGYTPIHTARQDFFNYGGYGWGYRKGAPFRGKVDKIKVCLLEAGLITKWLDQLLDAVGREARIKRRLRKTGKSQDNKEDGEEEEEKDEDEEEEEEDPEYTSPLSGPQVVLGMGHLQGIFYLLLIGQALAFLSFFTELFTHSRRRPHDHDHTHTLTTTTKTNSLKKIDI
ncbi:hypothetical protein Pcinc_016209 [Petrolisthes cinctipes]|uniref:Ionotropic glutamate receptor L-glutamate and glycine-binding domain-containing protein n=1 Tax=Petrolisthes cinctipes TaxID=88211 RepID=A0AAE1FTA8_PETCI|nr:hypothetical protein Pcinc_016209 [Petrolisthes cinctipes]